MMTLRAFLKNLKASYMFPNDMTSKILDNMAKNVHKTAFIVAKCLQGFPQCSVLRISQIADKTDKPGVTSFITYTLLSVRGGGAGGDTLHS